MKVLQYDDADQETHLIASMSASFTPEKYFFQADDPSNNERKIKKLLDE
jgi:hypothetical protein